MKKLNRKGFTLIELLVTIVIIGLIIGLSTFGIIKVLNNAKDKAKILSTNSLKDIARIYSSEASSDSWKEREDYDVFCVTVDELMNKGLLDKNVTFEEKNITKNTFIVVERNKITLSVEREKILDGTTDMENICSGEYINKGDDIILPKIDSSISYTDKIEISFTEGSATYNGNSSLVTYKCLYGETSSNINKEGTIVDNKCILNNLKNNTDYYALVYMNTSNGSSVTASGDNSFTTSNFNVTNIQNSVNTITINYNNKDNLNNDINDPKYYFESSINGTSNKVVEKCNYSNNVMNCSGSTTVIEKGTLYRSNDLEIKLIYPEDNNDVKITTRIYDGSNNYLENSKEFIIRKNVIRFYKGDADSIDGATSEYIEKSCIASAVKGSAASCNITSPNISKSGYTVLGWNRNSGATTSEWNVGVSKTVSESGNYYGIFRVNKVSINYHVNGGTIKSSTTSADGATTYNWTTNNSLIYLNGSLFTHNKNYGAKFNLSNYNNSKYIYITKACSYAPDGAEWICDSGCTTPKKTFDQDVNYTSTDFCNVTNGNCSVVLKVNWKTITYTIKYDANGGSGAPSSQTKTCGKDLILSTTTPTRSNYIFGGWKLKDGSKTYSAGETYTENADVTLYAIWIPKTVTVTFDANMYRATNRTTSNGLVISYDSSANELSLNGRGGDETISLTTGLSFKEGDTYTFAITHVSGEVSRTDTVFVVDIADNNGSVLGNTNEDRDYCDGIMVSDKKSTSCTFTVSSRGASKGTALKLWIYDRNGTTYTNYKINVKLTVTRTVTYGTKYGLMPPDPVKSGYTFNGWFTSSSGGTAVTADSIVTTASDHKVYPHWTSTGDTSGSSTQNCYWRTYTVKRYCGDGYGSECPVSGAYSSTNYWECKITHWNTELFRESTCTYYDYICT